MRTKTAIVNFSGGESGECIPFAVANLTGDRRAIDDTPKRPEGYLIADLSALVAKYLGEAIGRRLAVEPLIVAREAIDAATFVESIADLGAPAPSGAALPLFLKIKETRSGLLHCVLCFWRGADDVIEIHDNKKNFVEEATTAATFDRLDVRGVFVVVDKKNYHLIFKE
ncbi:MAG: hypothetical protein OET79_11365 [Nitrospirota bacterium]|nr:hypothetical protein [Nitrospirota bacterium]